MLKFLFWNLRQKQIQNLVGELSRVHDIDIVILAECAIAYADVLNSLNSAGSRPYTLTFSPNEHVWILTRLPNDSIKALSDFGGVTIRTVSPPIGSDLLLVAAHLPSKLYRDPDDQGLFATEIARKIEEAEKQVGHCRTVIVGDLNMNPFEGGVIWASALHGVMSRRIAAKRSRKIDGQVRHFFYNPMWSHLGDRDGRVPGTYFYNGGNQANYYWNIFDQVLIRPDLLKNFRDESLRIVTKVGKVGLLNKNGIPNKSIGSDHLPILFELNN